MRKFMAVCLFLLGSFAFAGAVLAQDAAKPAEATKGEPPAHYYRVTFTVQEVDQAGKPTNSRSYETTLSTHARPVSIRTGSRIPFVTATNKDGSPDSWQYLDTGVDIDVQQVQEVGRELGLTINADVRGAAKSDDPKTQQPIIRNNKWNAPVLVPIGKPTVVFTSDDLEDRGSLRMVVTATPIP